MAIGGQVSDPRPRVDQVLPASSAGHRLLDVDLGPTMSDLMDRAGDPLRPVVPLLPGDAR